MADTLGPMPYRRDPEACELCGARAPLHTVTLTSVQKGPPFRLARVAHVCALHFGVTRDVRAPRMAPGTTLRQPQPEQLW